jgi:hypothetical protein
VHETRERIPYLHVLNFLSSAYAVMTIGSTEQHYTASKIFQALLSTKPVFAIFHQQSSAVAILNECRATDFLVAYDPAEARDVLEYKIAAKLDLLITDSAWNPDLSKLEKYSAKASAKILNLKINEILDEYEVYVQK